MTVNQSIMQIMQLFLLSDSLYFSCVKSSLFSFVYQLTKILFFNAVDITSNTN